MLPFIIALGIKIAHNLQNSVSKQTFWPFKLFKSLFYYSNNSMLWALNTVEKIFCKTKKKHWKIWIKVIIQQYYYMQTKKIFKIIFKNGPIFLRFKDYGRMIYRVE